MLRTFASPKNPIALKVDIKGNTFTKRETEVVKLIVDEYTNPQIAEKLHISVRTVETHRKNILAKTGSKTVIGLFKFLLKNKFINR